MPQEFLYKSQKMYEKKIVLQVPIWTLAEEQLELPTSIFQAVLATIEARSKRERVRKMEK